VADLSIDRTDESDIEPDAFVPTSYPLKYALNARFMWNKHGLFPNGRCYDEQDPALIDDIERLNRRYNYHVDRLKDFAGKEWGGDSDSALFGGEDTPSMSLEDIHD
jgi:hypothetical protein